MAVTSACSSSEPQADANAQRSADSSAASGGGAIVSGASGMGAGSPRPVTGSAGARANTASGSAGSTSVGASAVSPTVVPSSAGGGGAATSSSTGGSVAVPTGGAAGGSGQTTAEPMDAAVDPSAPLTAVAFFPSKDRTDACADASMVQRDQGERLGQLDLPCAVPRRFRAGKDRVREVQDGRSRSRLEESCGQRVVRTRTRSFRAVSR